ncbi:MAG: shikimate dehydrogenase [Betaproteobacteria bacterium]|nr:shikimate dehydrogenase [Betaproteobacteria bacterium]
MTNVVPVVPLVRITGATRLYAIVGDPIAQVRSPEVFTGRFAAAGINAVLVPVHVPAASFDAIIPALLALGNLDGVLVTVPFKARMVQFASRLGPAAACIGAVNALRREADGSWSGDMFDGAGFVRGAETKGQRLRGRRVLQFGAGGAGSAIACALAEAGVASIRIVDPESGRVEALATALRRAFPDCDVAPATAQRGDVDMVVNASPVGMRPGDGMPGDIGALNSGTLVGDVVVSETPTPLIAQAQRDGCAWVNGRDMHSGQIEAIMGFFGARPAAAGGTAEN